MAKDTQISQAPQMFFLNQPPKSWYDNSLVGVIVGFFLGFIVGLIREYILKNKKKKSIIRNLGNEIGINYTWAIGSIKTSKDILERFTKLTSEVPKGTKSDTPRLVYLGIKNWDYYNIYFENLDLVDNKLEERIVYFYSILRAIDGRSKLLAQMFEDYYEGKNSVQPGDIIELFNKVIGQYEAVEVVGSEALASMYYSYKFKNQNLQNEETDEFKKKINTFLDKIKTGEKFKLRDLGNATNVGLLTCAFILKTIDNIEDVMIGEYKKL